MKNDGSSKDNPKIGVAAIVLNSKGEILIGFDGNKNKWAFPGGHWDGAENSETYEEAALREIFEETGGHYGKGIKCRIVRKVYERVFFRDDNKLWYKSIGYLAEYESGNLSDDPDEKRTKWQFLPTQSVENLDLFEPAKYGLSEYLKGK
jgi:ADP-ribose pyrophosphatase YjhB (NUDIX family)